jgi:hypothetical protein
MPRLEVQLAVSRRRLSQQLLAQHLHLQLLLPL